jgi:RND family efflux transporter MFP subunit
VRLRAAWLALATACSSNSGARSVAEQNTETADGGGESSEQAGVPVQVSLVTRTDLAVTAAGPGQTNALEQQKVRAPFRGTLTDLLVQDGDKVRDRQVLGHVLAIETEAALNGAQMMLRAAHTPQEREDAERALQIARKSMVKTALRAPEAGVVVAHGADEGALVTADQDIISLAAADSIVFIANIAQSDLARVRPTQPVTVEVPALNKKLNGRVHFILPAASPKDSSAPVRIDFDKSQNPLAVGLVGTAEITVEVHRQATAVPAAAVLRDDINGITRVATVDSSSKAHWIQVKTGIADHGLIEILSPTLEPGTRVISSGQVGLPDGSQVRVEQ